MAWWPPATGYISKHEVDAGLLDSFALVVVSPKLSNAGAQAFSQQRPEVLRRLSAGPNTWFKFVGTGVADLDEVAALIDAVGARRVMVMVEGTDPEASLMLTRALATPVIARGWSLSPRLHIWLWGDERGR